jgi:WD40 repeat protein
VEFESRENALPFAQWREDCQRRRKFAAAPFRENGSLLATYPIKAVYPITSSLSPQGDRLIVAHLDGQVSGFRLSDGSQVFETPAGETGAIQRTAFIPDGTRFITVATMRDSTQSVQFRDATTGRSLRSLRGGVGGVESICIHPVSGDLLVAGACTATWALPKYRQPAWRLPSTRLLSGFLGGDSLFPRARWRFRRSRDRPGRRCSGLEAVK